MTANIRFLLFLFIVLLFVYSLHTGILYLSDMPLFEHQIMVCYSINFIVAALLLVLIQSNINKQSSNTAFIFMIGSVVKFILFFALILPNYKADGVVVTAEFAAFFVPYVTCLFLEVAYLSKQLNNQNYS